MNEPKKARAEFAMKPTEIEGGLYVLGNLYADVDDGYFAESPLKTGILRSDHTESDRPENL